VTVARRLAISALLVLALASVGCGEGRHAHPGGSTLKTTLVDRDRNGWLEPGPGEPFVNRTDLAPARRSERTLATFAQITDVHVSDEESPARAPFLDRLGPPLNSTFRPQEALQPQLLASAVAALNRLDPQAVVETGDLIDNDQRNELDQALRVLRGGRVDPNSGSRRYTGVQDGRNPDAFYYRPDVDAPRHPGILAAAQRPFTSPGLRAPWYPVLGNHDFMVGGVLPPTALTRRVAVGSRRLNRLAPGSQSPDQRALTAAAIDRVLAAAPRRLTSNVAPDRRRREMSVQEVVASLRRASGHGGRGRRLDYSFDIGPRVRGVVLDVLRRDGDGGELRAEQLRWLGEQLRRAGRRYVVVFTHEPLRKVDGGESALGLLDEDPRVVAAVAGDSHRNEVEPRHTARGGYWLITTSSLIDFPQHARAFRLVQTAGGGIALETWLLDHGPGPRGLASVSRELAFLDSQGGRPSGFRGSRRDRNVRLFVR
jgi:metallophosphoesterase (TIGR03767 family)